MGPRLEKNTHSIQLPREVLIGWGVLSKVGEVCRELGFSSSAFLLTGPKTSRIAAGKAKGSLEKSGFRVKNLIIESSEMRYVSEAEKMIKKSRPQVVLGVGGGKVIDVAKVAASKCLVPFVSVPTTASHDGIASQRASIRDLKTPTSILAQTPIGVVADTEVILQSPYRLTASGCGDIVSKYTAVRDWKLAHDSKGEYYGEYAASLALMSAKLVIRNAKVIRGRTEEGIRVVMEALLSCGIAMSIAGSSRPGSGSEHLFSHALDQVAPKPALHGEQCGVGAIMMAHLHEANWKLIKDSLRKLGAPTTAEELGIEPDYIIEALTRAHRIRPDRYTILGEKGLTRDAARRLAKTTGVIE